MCEAESNTEAPEQFFKNRFDMLDEGDNKTQPAGSYTHHSNPSSRRNHHNHHHGYGSNRKDRDSRSVNSRYNNDHFGKRNRDSKTLNNRITKIIDSNINDESGDSHDYFLVKNPKKPVSPTPASAPLTDTNLNMSWNLWWHPFNMDWSIDSYRLVYKISNINDFWGVYNTLNDIDGLWNNNMLYLMREGIPPLWEDEKNVNGCSLCFRVLKNECKQVWNTLSMKIMGETLVTDDSIMEKINGISISPKNNTVTIRIWFSADNINAANLKGFHVNGIELERSLYRKNSE